MPIASYRQFRIEVADDWSAMIERDATSDYLKITPSTHTAELRLTTFDTQQMSAKDWVDFAAHTNRVKNRPVVRAEVGPMAGYEVQFSGGSTWVRGWVLECNGIPLDITYRSDVGLQGHDDIDIDSMLKSLQIDPITEQTGAGQPAARPVVEPEGNDKPQPESAGALSVAGCQASTMCKK